MNEPAFQPEKHPSALENNPLATTEITLKSPPASPRNRILLLTLLWLSWSVYIASDTLSAVESFYIGVNKHPSKLQLKVHRTLHKHGMRKVCLPTNIFPVSN
jgi:hypothetical protein